MLLDPGIMFNSSPLKQILMERSQVIFVEVTRLKWKLRNRRKDFLNSKQDVFLIGSILICVKVFPGSGLGNRLRARQEDKEVYCQTATLRFRNRLTIF